MAKERDLTRGSVADDVWALAVPAGLSLLFITLYNVTDVFYAGLLSAEAQAGLGVGTQVFFAVTALGIGLRVGLAAVVGRKLGASGLDEASPSATEALGVAVAVTLGGVLLCLLGLPLLIELVGVGIVVIWTAGPWLVGLLSASGQVQEGAIAFLRVRQ